MDDREQKQSAQRLINEAQRYRDAVDKKLNKEDRQAFWRFIDKAQAINPTIAVDRNNPKSALENAVLGLQRVVYYDVAPEERGEITQQISEKPTVETKLPPIPVPPSQSVSGPGVSLPSVGVPNITNIPGAGRVGRGIFGRVAKTGVGKSLKALGTKAIAKLGLEGILAAGSGGLSIVAQALLELIGKAWNWIKTKLKINSKKIAEYLGALTILLTPFVFVSAVAAGGAVVAGLGAFAMGGSAAFSSGARTILNGILAVLAAVITIMATPIIISLIVIPLFLAVTIFIITSGGYIVPPGDRIPLGSGEAGTGIGGEYPSCWPTHGIIVQGPYCETGTFTHCCRDLNGDGEFESSECTGFLNAIDIAGVEGTPVYATHDGIASLSSGGGYGDAIIITSPLGFSTLYGHLLQRFVVDGQEVKAGDEIGLMDGDPSDPNPGISTGTHLHYELRGTSYNIDQIVPTYTYEAQTSGCFASEAGGGSEPPIGGGTPQPSTPPGPTSTPVPPGGGACASDGGTCTDSCSSTCQLLDPGSGWDDCKAQGKQYCCDTTGAKYGPQCSTGTSPASCTSTGGECSSSSTCVPEQLPAGASGWDCPASAPKCCLKGLPSG